MKYNNTDVRRQDRLLEEEIAILLLEQGEYGVLSMVGEEGGYGIPLNFVWDKKGSIYFHCAPEGKKLCLLAKEAGVSFCIVGKTHVVSNKFTTEYESVIIKGTMKIELPDDEKMFALELLLDKYSPNDKVVGKKYAEMSFARTAVIRLDIDEYAGKCKRKH